MRVEDESKVVQDVVIKPRNIRFQRHVHYSAEQNKYFRGPLPSGYDVGDFGADLRALILSLKYCGNMSEPKIREFLENFDLQISAGSVSNILTKTADSFEQEFDDIVRAGLASTPYQQTDDTSARVAIGTAIVRCRNIVRVQATRWRPRCGWKSMNCFRLGRATQHWTIALRRRRQSETSY